jgi:DNA-binding response OmpR family regulator
LHQYVTTASRKEVAHRPYTVNGGLRAICSSICRANVADGKAALVALKVHRPRLILLDLTMPEMEGGRFREEQERLDDRELASIPIVLLSARPDHHEHASRIGAVAAIPKPINLDRLLAVIREHYRR